MASVHWKFHAIGSKTVNWCIYFYVCFLTEGFVCKLINYLMSMTFSELIMICVLKNTLDIYSTSQELSNLFLFCSGFFYDWFHPYTSGLPHLEQSMIGPNANDITLKNVDE